MVGDKIREIRKEHNMTQEQLAQKIGVKRSVVSKYETGNIVPSIDQLYKIADVFSIWIGELLDNMTGDIIDNVIKKSAGAIVYGALQKEDEEIERTNAKLDIIVEIMFEELNEKGQQVAVERVQELARIAEYRKPSGPSQPQAKESEPDSDPNNA
ncbi:MULTISPECIES: helix-turn-helix domain-containing protein [Eubacteriales]|uniref:DNA-binding transcriptional regulator, XRE-family HTH domain n=1 Tax=Bittarella massiliensis (ex Durand et al. 2017) TaxID=1720313 RepID=A0AAQ1RW91_9FIRM|nr:MULTISPECIES: helix-turn-helix transcriptional regulator [Eubacteriales]SHG16977.1 DNA-binding transcriptional regulator, XRE-family HTH domain [Bittarella massiliensis (ex Durand et al. 2017)]SHG17316.1 DNA-binding transcriptional regulator, XRE-family HTH domain [Bittarella massiliensis (ex Durand et al. 2017)]